MNVMLVGLLCIALYFVIAIAWLLVDKQQEPVDPSSQPGEGADR